jgi:hypothetical protein
MKKLIVFTLCLLFACTTKTNIVYIQPPVEYECSVKYNPDMPYIAFSITECRIIYKDDTTVFLNEVIDLNEIPEGDTVFSRWGWIGKVLEDTTWIYDTLLIESDTIWMVK